VDADHTRPLPADGRPADKLTLARALIEEVARRLDGWTRSAAA
jgi:phosphopantothenoylcysteine decarboxylase/phosphopantothenate--cysteine ligase